MIESKLIFGDCLEGIRSLPDSCIDLCCSDPPYLIGYHTARRRGEHKFKHEIVNDSGEKAKHLVASYIHECYRVLKDNTAAYFFCSSKTLDFFRKECENAGFAVKNIIIWDKGNWTAGDLKCQYGQSYEPIVYCNKGKRPLNGKRIPDIWRFKRVPSNRLVHQNQKPVEVMEQCILKSSETGGVILDGFMGSGTTAVAAIRLKRHFIGWEIDKQYYDIAAKRVREAEQQLSLF